MSQPKEYAYFLGKKYTRYPEAALHAHRAYYGKTTKPKTLLHRDIWEHFNGPIPTGHEIHHQDFSPDNNSPNNLVCLTKSEHMKLHGRRRFTDPAYKAKAIAGMHSPEAIAKSTAWKHSEAGKAHLARPEQRKGLYQKGVFICDFCHKVYEGTIMGKNKYCGPNCGAKAWRRDHPGYYDYRKRK